MLVRIVTVHRAFHVFDQLILGRDSNGVGMNEKLETPRISYVRTCCKV